MNGKKTALIVSGMHRSGTSSIAGVLGLLGAALPKDLKVPLPDNARGFFESQAITDFNDRILADCGSVWNDWRALPNSWQMNPRFTEYHSAATVLFAEEYSGSDFIVLKDPRICRILPFWNLVLEDSGYECFHIVPLRHPDSVAASLCTRDRFGKAAAHMLWLRHVIDAEEYSRGQKRIFLTWSNFLADWEGQVGRISAGFRFSWPRLSDNSRAEVNEFLSSELRHHPEAEIFGIGRIAGSEYVQRAYEAAARLVDDPYSPEGMTLLDSLRKDVDRTERIYGPLYAEYELTEKRLVADLARQKDRAVALNARVNDLEPRLKYAEDARDASIVSANALRDQVSLLESQQNSFRQSRDAAQAAADSLADTLEQLQCEYDGWRRKTQAAQRRTVNDVTRLDGAEFIAGAYDALLQREPDAAGMEFYLRRLQRGASKIRILAELYASDEAKLVGVRLRGLEAEISRHQLLEMPVLGGIFRLFLSR